MLSSSNIDKVIKNNKNIINIAGTIHDNRITELNEENSLDVTLHQQITCTGRIRNDRVIEVNEEIIEEGSANIIPIYQQNYAKYLSHYRSQKKQQLFKY